MIRNLFFSSSSSSSSSSFLPFRSLSFKFTRGCPRPRFFATSCFANDDFQLLVNYNYRSNGMNLPPLYILIISTFFSLHSTFQPQLSYFLETRPIAISRVLTLKNYHSLRLCIGRNTCKFGYFYICLLGL